jgi:hypothetical protein
MYFFQLGNFFALDDHENTVYASQTPLTFQMVVVLF